MFIIHISSVAGSKTCQNHVTFKMSCKIYYKAFSMPLINRFDNKLECISLYAIVLNIRVMLCWN